MNERFINPCVELGGESWLSSETEDLEELPESFGRLQSRGRRGALTHCFHRPSWDGLEQMFSVASLHFQDLVIWFPRYCPALEACLRLFNLHICLQASKQIFLQIGSNANF